MTTTMVADLSFQSTIENLLRATGRDNVDQLLTFMRDNGYYRAGCHRHHKHQGGLAQHSLEVLLRMQRQNESSLPVDSIVIVALLHDLCNIKGFNHIRHHGSRSVLLATREAGFKLTHMEYQAILWHMHSVKEKGKICAQFDAVLDNPLWQLLRKADYHSATHPLSRQELVYAMSGKPRRTDRIVPVSGEACKESCPKDVPTKRPELSPEEKHRRTIRRNTVSITEVFQALEDAGINPVDAFNTVINSYYEQHRNGSNSSAVTANAPSVNNDGFKLKYRETATPEQIETHRTELIDRCAIPHGAAKRVAQYIYEETDGVFNCQWPTNDIYLWLKSEFGLPASRDNFYKACHNITNYTNRR